MPDAAGLVLATDQADAHAYAEIVERVTGARAGRHRLRRSRREREDHRGSRASGERIAVCVRMVSEGVDLPRAACLAWMTSYRTPLFFAQAVGRVVRSRGRHESATVFLPAVRPLLALAADLEDERNHVIPPPAPSSDVLDIEVIETIERDEALGDGFEALDADAEFAHLLHGGRAVVADSTPTACASRSRRRCRLPRPARAALARADRRSCSPNATPSCGIGRARRTPTAAGAEPPAEVVAWRAAAELRREVNRMVSVVAARTGASHAPGAQRSCAGWCRARRRRPRRPRCWPSAATSCNEMLAR